MQQLPPQVKHHQRQLEIGCGIFQSYIGHVGSRVGENQHLRQRGFWFFRSCTVVVGVERGRLLNETARAVAISGGSGAGGVFDEQGRLVGGFEGTSVVQTHMSNSRLTDPEVLEWRFPVRLESYAIRPGSGGAGRWRGGDGGVRRLRFLQPMTASILSNGRVHGAFGMAGGSVGAVGLSRVVRADGRVQALGHIGSAQMQAGDLFEIHTPGGGGFGLP